MNDLLPGMTEQQSSWFRFFVDEGWVTLIYGRRNDAGLPTHVTVLFKKKASQRGMLVVFWHLQELKMGWRPDHSVDGVESIRVSLIGLSGFDIPYGN